MSIPLLDTLLTFGASFKVPPEFLHIKLKIEINTYSCAPGRRSSFPRMSFLYGRATVDGDPAVVSELSADHLRTENFSFAFYRVKF